MTHHLAVLTDGNALIGNHLGQLYALRDNAALHDDGILDNCALGNIAAAEWIASPRLNTCCIASRSKECRLWVTQSDSRSSRYLRFMI